MIYYPLQLLQLAGVREVLVVTGKQHAGQMIDLLGDGRLCRARLRRAAPRPRSHLQGADEAGGIAQVVGMAATSRPATSSSSCLGDNIFEYAHAEAICALRDGDDGAAVFVKDVPDPENFGVVAYDGDGRVADIVEKAGVVDTRYDAPPSSDAVVGLYCYPAGRVRRDRRRSSRRRRGELEITDVNRHYAERGALELRRVAGWWEDAGQAGALAEIGAPDRGDRASTSRDRRPAAHPAPPLRGRARLVRRAAPRERCCRSRRGRRTSPSRAAA